MGMKVNPVRKAKDQGPGFTGNSYEGAAKPASSAIPGGGGGMGPSGHKQSSGKTIHNRPGGMNGAGKGENLDGFPTSH